MYAVFSLLRRFAGTCVYVSAEHLDPRMRLRLESPAEYLDLSTGKWEQPSQLIPMTELVVQSATQPGAAISISKMETALAERMGAEKFIYTIVLGPEAESTADGVVERRVRLAIIRGIYRASSSVLKREEITASQRVAARFRKPRPGTVRLD